jgi:hypothetical protein
MSPARLAVLALCGLLVPAAVAAGAAAPAPALERGAARELALTRLPPLLGRQEVRRHLETGLTTTFAFDVRVAGPGKVRGGGRIDIRYELWDEVWLVTRLDALDEAQRLRFPTFEKLETWWRDLRLPVLPGVERAARSAPGSAEIRLRVIPFSQSEQLDAQRWFSRSLAEESGRPGAVAGVRDRPSEDLLQLLLATSIGRTSLLELEWEVALPAASPESPGGRR